MLRVAVHQRNFAVVLKHAETLNLRVEEAAGRGLALGLEYTVSVSQEKYLSGPRPAKLDVRTTRLRNSIVSKVERFATGWRGRIGTNAPYGPYHEFGLRGTVQVAAHTRIPKVFSLLTGKTEELRQSFRDAKGAFIGFKESNARALQRVRNQETVWAPTQNVKAHTRKVNYAGRPFVRPALEETLPVILKSIETELAKLK